MLSYDSDGAIGVFGGEASGSADLRADAVAQPERRPTLLAITIGEREKET